MSLKPISATDLRTRTREIMQRARFHQETFLVENFGQPMVVIVGVQEYERLVQRPLSPDAAQPVMERYENMQ